MISKLSFEIIWSVGTSFLNYNLAIFAKTDFKAKL